MFLQNKNKNCLKKIQFIQTSHFVLFFKKNPFIFKILL